MTENSLTKQVGVDTRAYSGFLSGKTPHQQLPAQRQLPPGPCQNQPRDQRQ